jgi:hypothetical protein
MSEEQNPALEGEIVDNGENSREIGKLNLPAQTLPTTVHILPMTEKPFFPAQTLPLIMNEGPWMETVKQIGESGHHLVGLVAWYAATYLGRCQAGGFLQRGHPGPDASPDALGRQDPVHRRGRDALQGR